MKKVEIHIKGGVAHIVEIPENVEVIIRDYDNDPVFIETAKLENGEIIYTSGT